MRKAIDALAADNLVVRRQGKGTFVATHTEERSSLFRFLRIRRNDGGDVAPVSRLLDVKRAQGRRRRRAPARAQARRRACWCCGACSTTPASRWCSTRSRCPRRCSAASPRRATTPIAARCTASSRAEFGVRMLKAQEKIRAVAADAATARMLGHGGGRAAAGGRSRDADLRRPARRGAPRPVRDARLSLPERAAIERAGARFGLRSRARVKRRLGGKLPRRYNCVLRTKIALFGCVARRISPTPLFSFKDFAHDGCAGPPRRQAAPGLSRSVRHPAAAAGVRLDPAPHLRRAAVPDRHSVVLWVVAARARVARRVGRRCARRCRIPSRSWCCWCSPGPICITSSPASVTSLMDLHIGMDLQVGAARPPP